MGIIIRLLLIVAVVAIVWSFISRARVRASSQASRPREPDAQAMVSCAHCGMHLPQPDALAGDGGHYCTAEHRQLGPRER